MGPAVPQPGVSAPLVRGAAAHATVGPASSRVTVPPQHEPTIPIPSRRDKVLMSDLNTAEAEQARDSSTSLERLGDLADMHPELHSLLLTNPSCPTDVRAWILRTNPEAGRAWREEQERERARQVKQEPEAFLLFLWLRQDEAPLCPRYTSDILLQKGRDRIQNPEEDQNSNQRPFVHRWLLLPNEQDNQHGP